MAIEPRSNVRLIFLFSEVNELTGLHPQRIKGSTNLAKEI